MSPSLFNIYIKEVVDKIHEAETGIWIQGLCFSVLAFADDLVVIGNCGNPSYQTKQLQTSSTFYKQIGISI